MSEKFPDNEVKKILAVLNRIGAMQAVNTAIRFLF